MAKQHIKGEGFDNNPDLSQDAKDAVKQSDREDKEQNEQPKGSPIVSVITLAIVGYLIYMAVKLLFM